MQLHEEPSSENSLSTSQHRVTPEELTRALAAIEARKQEAIRRQEAEDKYLAETIPVEEAVRELNLEATPEEIWAEVEAQRAEAKTDAAADWRLHEQQPETERISHFSLPYDSNSRNTSIASSSSWKPLWLGAACAGLFAWLCILGLHSSKTYTVQSFMPFNTTTNPSYTARPQAYEPMLQFVLVPGSEFFRNLALTQGEHPTKHLVRVSLGTFSKGMAGVEVRPEESAYPCRAVPDGYTVYENILSQPAPGKLFGIVFRSPAEMSVQDERENNSISASASPLVMTTRYDGYDYLRCWITKSDIPALKLGRPFTLSTTPTTADGVAQGMTPLTVKLDEVLPFLMDSHPEGDYAQRSALEGNGIRITQDHPIRLDSHAWEDFTMQAPAPFIAPDWAKTTAFVDYDYRGEPGQGQAISSWLDASSDAVMLHNVPDGKPFHCDEKLVQHLLEPLNRESSFTSATPTSENLVDIRPQPQRFLPYTLIKHKGHVYLFGWVLSRLPGTEMRQNQFPIYGRKDVPALGESPSQIVVPLDKVHIVFNSELGNTPVAWITNVQSNLHTWEKWQP